MKSKKLFIILGYALLVLVILYTFRVVLPYRGDLFIDYSINFFFNLYFEVPHERIDLYLFFNFHLLIVICFLIFYLRKRYLYKFSPSYIVTLIIFSVLNILLLFLSWFFAGVAAPIIG